LAFGMFSTSLKAIPLRGHADDVVVEVILIHLRPGTFPGYRRCLNGTFTVCYEGVSQFGGSFEICLRKRNS
jgi:hypothetical protein